MAQPSALDASERRASYKAQAAKYASVREFPGATARAKKTRERAIRFICQEDAVDVPDHEGFWMQLSQWNRYRHYTYKDRPDDELPFMRKLPDADAEPMQDAAEPQKNT